MGIFSSQQKLFQDLKEELREQLENFDKMEYEVIQESQGVFPEERKKKIQKKNEKQKTSSSLNFLEEQDPTLTQRAREARREEVKVFEAQEEPEDYLGISNLPYWTQGIVAQTILERPKSRRNRRRF